MLKVIKVMIHRVMRSSAINDVAVLDAIRIEESQVTDQAQKRAFIQNQYGPEGGFNDLINIRDIERKIEQRETYYTFVASTYNSLTSTDKL